LGEVLNKKKKGYQTRATKTEKALIPKGGGETGEAQ